MKIGTQDYERLKGFYAWMVEHVLTWTAGLPPEHRPLAVLAEFEARAMSRARQGLGLAIGDLIEDTENFPSDEVERIDRALGEAGLPTLSEVRLRFSSAIAGILKRGKVRSEREYYALRNVVEAMPDTERDEVWLMLAEFEARIRSQRGGM